MGGTTPDSQAEQIEAHRSAVLARIAEQLPECDDIVTDLAEDTDLRREIWSSGLGVEDFKSLVEQVQDQEAAGIYYKGELVNLGGQAKLFLAVANCFKREVVGGGISRESTSYCRVKELEFLRASAEAADATIQGLRSATDATWPRVESTLSHSLGD